jgi:hypothetical protein
LTFRTIHTITGDSNLDFQIKRQKREYYHQVNHVAIKGPVTQTKWSHIPVTFSEADIKLVSFPHTDGMVITTHVDKWDVTRVLIDNDSQVDILFLLAFNQMGFDRKQLKEESKPLYGFGGKRIEPVGSISLSVSFGSLCNTRTEYITFDVMDMNYPYNAIFGRGLLNTFEAALHSSYLCLKISVTLGVIIVHGNQKDARNIEQDFTLGQRNVNCLQDEKSESTNDTTANKNKECFTDKPAIEPECEIKRVPLDPRVPDKIVMISQDLSPSEEMKLLSFLDKNSDVFTWKTSDLTGVNRSIIEHKLLVNPSAKPKK